jgi:membrane associated rhomboid family serine protease
MGCDVDTPRDMVFAERRVSNNGGMIAQLTPVVKWLLVLNLGIYFADMLVFDFGIRERFSFAIQSALVDFGVWEFITFQFIHGSVGHVLFNCMGLFFFGPWMERWCGPKRFLFFYLVCGVGGAVLYTVLQLAGALPSSDLQTGLVGASAGIYGILVGVAVIAPTMRVSLLFPPVTLTMRQLALALLAISVGSIVLKIGGNEGGEAGHLGGAIMGFVLMKTKGWMGWVRGKTGSPRGRPASDFTPKIRPRTRIDLHGQSEVDAILEKISRDGFQSLTDEERDVLQRAAKQGEKQGL